MSTNIFGAMANGMMDQAVDASDQQTQFQGKLQRMQNNQDLVEKMQTDAMIKKHNTLAEQCSSLRI
ncbi:hypothetical protein [Mitsuaria sp. GD03876]|uniref:hypothetical protein n=1 Tax=Mitsuaria sp. GD03876 TaxID=2975399 RepID=UPI00244AA868|nr:hypothetical protein [Mitsuaria sp. GD03876]MDH0865322.1 hypothetical protein [Mitsuaria sp. GD03876]